MRFTPRNVLKRVLAAYDKRGLKPVVAPEIEFYLTAPNDDADAFAYRADGSPLLRGGKLSAGGRRRSGRVAIFRDATGSQWNSRW